MSEFNDYLSDSFKANVIKKVSLHVDSDAQPVFSKARQVPIKLRPLLKVKLDRLVEEGKLVKLFSSNWASPIVTVFKNDSSIRICGDFSGTVNKYLNPVSSPLPTVDDVISRTGKATVYSKIDLSEAFLQLPLDDYSKQFTVINTPEGLYQYLPFGLTASSGIFQAFLTELLSHIDSIVVYQDDILILSADHDSHVKTIRQVLCTLKSAGIKVNSKKCKFFEDNIKYLGHIFDKNGVHTNPDKTKSILDAPAPQNVKQVQAFIGLCNYYSRFVPDFARTMKPLYKLLEKNSKFFWDKAQQETFDRIKSLFKSHDVLQHYDPNGKLTLETDSSAYGIGACLMQRTNSKPEWLPIQFASRTLNKAEQHYSNIEREALSVIFGIEKFRNYLLGTKFVIKNDQKPLFKIFAHDKSIPTSCSARIQRWALKLSQFNYSLILCILVVEIM